MLCPECRNVVGVFEPDRDDQREQDALSQFLNKATKENVITSVGLKLAPGNTLLLIIVAGTKSELHRYLEAHERAERANPTGKQT